MSSWAAQPCSTRPGRPSTCELILCTVPCYKGMASRAGAGRQPVPAPGHGPARLGPARIVTSRVTASRWPRRGDVTRGRDHRPPALPPGPLPNRVSLFGVRRCARAPTGVCQGPRALTQRSPRTGRFAAMRVQPREAHWRRGLAQPPSLGRAKDEEELRARVRSDARRRARRRVAMGLELRGAGLLRGAFGSGSPAGPASG